MDKLKTSRQKHLKQHTAVNQADKLLHHSENWSENGQLSLIMREIFSTKLNTRTQLLALSVMLASPNVLAENYQANGWQCQQMNNGQWNCAAADGQYAPSVVTGAHIPLPVPANSVVKTEPKFPEPDFTDPNVGPSGGIAVIQPVYKPQTPGEVSTWSSCAVQPMAEIDRKAMQAKADESTNIEADEAVSPDANQINFSGNVVITKNIQKLTAEQASYNKTNSIFDAKGNVVISEPGIILKGDTARYQSDERKGRLDNARYELPSRPAQGVADNIRFKPGTINLDNPTYSTCPASDPDWELSASDLELHTEEGYGEGTHAVMRFKGVPIAYTPYIRFPLNNERQSGFLMPSIGSSDSNGFEVATPYYFNIAPDQDATLTPRILSDRGLMLGGEYRYLSEHHSGEVYAEWLNDRSYDDKRDTAEIALREGDNNNPIINAKQKPEDISKNRGAFSLQQRANWGNGWSGNIDYNYVTDRYYLEDFGNNLRDKSETHLLREGLIQYHGDIFNFMARAQGYQELRSANHTYSRLPQLTLSANDDYTTYGVDLRAGFDSEFVTFAQNWDDIDLYNNDPDNERVEGSRFHISLNISLPFRNSYSFITPKISLDMVTYKLTNENKDPKYFGSVSNPNASLLDDDAPSRVAPIVSLDSGLYFDRDLTLFNLPMQQTLEPRLYYLYVPERDQSDIPIFDTSLSTFSFNQLFRENRFTGFDRLGDANQITAALTSRLLDSDSGRERLTASIGQIYYFEDRNVTLNYDSTGKPDPVINPLNPSAEENINASSSAIATEITSRFARNWYTSYSLLYDPNHGGQTDEARYRLQYKSDRYHLANLDYSYRAGDYEQIEASAYWKIVSQWRALAHWYYSLYDNQARYQYDTTTNTIVDTPKNSRDSYTLDAKVGVEYDSCCYALRFVIGKDQTDYFSDSNNYVMMQIQFKGLGSIGQSIGGGGNLVDDIPGFVDWQN